MPNRNLQFNGAPLEPHENRWVRHEIYRQDQRRRLWQAWLAIPPLIVTLVSIAGTVWGLITGLFH